MILKRSLKVIQTGTIRKLGCGFLFAFHSNYGSILHHFRDKARYWAKNRDFSYPLAFGAPLGGSPSEYSHPVWYGTRGQSNLTKSASRGAYSPVRSHPKVRRLKTTGWQKILDDMYNRLHSIPACDRYTDRHLAMAQSALCIRVAR